MRCFLTCLAAVSLPCSAFAQDINPAQSLAQSRALEPSRELSELDRLSLSVDDLIAGESQTADRVPVSVTLRALNKITARYTDIEINMHEIAEFGSLELQPRSCDTRPPEEFPETTVFLEVFDKSYDDRKSDLKVELPPQPVTENVEIESEDFEVLTIAPTRFGEVTEDPAAIAAREPVMEEPAFGARPTDEVTNGPQAEGVNIFRGWMFASSPALNALEHPVYDVWVINCTTRTASN